MRKLMHCLIFLASLPLEAQLANLAPKHSPSEPDVERLGLLCFPTCAMLSRMVSMELQDFGLQN